MKRLLILSYYFPPAGGPGVQRMLKTVHYLPDSGWEPIVVTVRTGAYSDLDRSLWSDVPDGTLVRRTRALEPYATYARLTGQADDDAVKVGTLGEAQSWRETLAHWVRANMFVPDARVGWIPFAVRAALQIARAHPVDAILTTGPPHSAHLSGWILHRRTGLPWVADFRDPWTDINYYHELPHTACARRLDRALEHGVLRNAGAVTTVSPSWRRLLAQKVTPAPHVHVIHNGFDERDFAAPPSVERGEEFVLTHVGSMYASRNPEALWRTLAALRGWGELARLRIRLVGSVDESVLRSIQAHQLGDIVEHIPYVPHAEAVAEMCRSTLLLLVIEAFPQNAGMITGKLYEYLASGRPVVGLGPPDGDAASLLQDTGAGRLLASGDEPGLQRTLLAHYHAWETGTMIEGAPLEKVIPYSRRAQTERLAGALDALVGPP